MPIEDDQAGQWLRAARADVRDQLDALQDTFGDIVAATASVATDDEHDPEGATIAFERAQVDALRARARQHLEDIDWALGRLADGHYGECTDCGQPIAEARLEARPAARTCIRCAERRRP